MKSFETVEHKRVGGFGAREVLTDLLVGSVRVIRVARAIGPPSNLTQALLLLELAQGFVHFCPVFVQLLVLVADELVVVVCPLVVEVVHGEVVCSRAGRVVVLLERPGPLPPLSLGLAEGHTGLGGLHGLIVVLLHLDAVLLDLLLINVHSVADPFHLMGELVPRVLLRKVERSLRAVHGEEVGHLIVGESLVLARLLHLRRVL